MGRKITVKCIGIGARPFPLCQINTENLRPGEVYTAVDYRVECGYSLWEIEGVGWAPTSWFERPILAPQY